MLAWIPSLDSMMTLSSDASRRSRAGAQSIGTAVCLWTVTVHSATLDQMQYFRSRVNLRHGLSVAHLEYPQHVSNKFFSGAVTRSCFLETLCESYYFKAPITTLARYRRKLKAATQTEPYDRRCTSHERRCTSHGGHSRDPSSS